MTNHSQSEQNQNADNPNPDNPKIPVPENVVRRIKGRFLAPLWYTQRVMTLALERCLRNHELLALRLKMRKNTVRSILRGDCGMCNEHLMNVVALVDPKHFDPDLVQADYQPAPGENDVRLMGVRRPNIEEIVYVKL